MIPKQTFLAALDCDTAGWYQHRAPTEPLSASVEWLFHTGNEVGRLAQDWLGPGVRLPFAPTETATRATAAALVKGEARVLFEATFVAGEFIARGDALRRTGSGWELIEVKSALTPEQGKVKREHIDDIAYTTFVANSSGRPVTRCTLVFIDRATRLGSPLLAEVDVTDVVLARAAEFAAEAPRIAAACASIDRPPPELKLACKNCPFYESDCIGKGIPDPLFILPRLLGKRFEALRPYGRLSAVPADASLTDQQRRVFDAVRTGTPQVAQAVLDRLKDLTWPVYYLDFETVGPALPWFEGAPPYVLMPFQYSIHVCDRPGREVAHHEFLAPIGGDWREALAISLIEDLGDHGTIAMYTDYEQKCIEEMAQALPHFAAPLQAIIARLVDLEPIVKDGYCHPGFRGRTSIKNVLPVVAPDLSYATMEVGNGLDAAGLFALMTVGRRDPGDFEMLRRQLLEYCKLDTLAMVKLHAALAAI